MTSMKPKVAIIDYQMSNLFSVEHACSFVDLDAKITFDKKEIANADAAILPGVGAFGDAMKNLERLDLLSTIHEFIASGKPFMGVCLGLQLLFSESEEFGTHTGLGIIPGKVVKFPNQTQTGQRLKVPQIGWNTIHAPVERTSAWEDSPLRTLRDGEFMYFVHSFYVQPEKKEHILSLTTYEDLEYCSSIMKENVFATQFHPEKSGPEGINIYRNWKLRIR